MCSIYTNTQHMPTFDFCPDLAQACLDGGALKHFCGLDTAPEPRALLLESRGGPTPLSIFKDVIHPADKPALLLVRPAVVIVRA